MEVTVPSAALDEIPEMLDEASVAHVWTTDEGDGTGLVRVLLEAEETEAVSDLFVGRFGPEGGFRLVLLAVEATLPAVEREEKKEAEEEGPGGEAGGGEGGKDEGRGPRRIGREELYEDISQASRLDRVYLAMVALSTVVAAVGLIRGDTAIVIGAMVIAPLLGPNVALSLACTLGDVELAKRSLRAIGAGVATAAAISILLGLALDVDPAAPELAARTRAGLGDLALALAAGAAGSLAFTSGVPAVLVGVMVAVALLPPLVAAGLLAGAGYPDLALGALALMLTNVACVNLAAIGTFLVQRVRPRTWWEADRARKATRVAIATWLVLLGLLVGLIALGRVGGI